MRKEKRKTFLKQIFGLFIIAYLIIVALYLLEIINTHFLIASFYAGGLNLINSLIAFWLLEYSYGKSNKIFMIAVMGGMVARLFALLILIFIFLAFLNIDKYGFILTFFIFYFILIVLEINFVRIRAKTKEIIR